MKRLAMMLLLVAALLTASCGLRVDMPTLGSVDAPSAVAVASEESAR